MVIISIAKEREDVDAGDQCESYGIDDPAPWSISILSGIQHFLAMIGGTLTIPYLLFPYYCVGPNNPARGDIAASLFFASGITTILQSAVGSRLPIMQGSTFSYLTPIYVMFDSLNMRCPNITEISESTANITLSSLSDEIWQKRISTVQGSLMLASLFEIVLGFTGVIGYILPFVTPLTILPVQTLVGFAVLEESVDFCSGNWSIAILTLLLLIIFSEPLKGVRLPTFSYSKTQGLRRSKGVPIFQLFPVLLVIIIVWIFCIILTYCNVFSDNSPARTDLNERVISQANWFRVPYPTQWGPPTLNVVCFVGMLGATFANIMEAIGNYYTCARMSKAPPPPVHAVNRGVMVEGIGTLLDGLVGIGNGTSSYAENIGIIGMTKMASRRMMYVAGLFMIMIGVFTKLSAVFMVIPDPILGGVFLFLFCTICTMGLGFLQYVDMNSSRNLLVIGLPIYCGLAFPMWLKKHPDAFETGYELVDGILLVCLRTGMFIGGVLGLLMDNLLPGTPEERGLIRWNELKGGSNAANVSVYDFPWKNFRLKKSGFMKKIPFCPGYVPIRFGNIFSKKKTGKCEVSTAQEADLNLNLSHKSKEYNNVAFLETEHL